MSNLKTNLFTGDTYIQSSLDPSIYGTGNLNIDGNLNVTGTVASAGNSFLSIPLTGLTSGIITIRPQDVTDTYNFNLPTSSGTSGQVLVSGGGGSTPMYWLTAGSGTVTSVSATVPTFLSISGSPITSSGTLAISLSGTALPVTSGGTGSTTATGTGSVVLANTPTLITPVIGAATGTSLSVTGVLNSLTKTITGSTSGVITIQGQAAAGTYNYNLPITAGSSGQVLTSGGGGSTAMSWITPSTGTVTSVSATVPAFLSISGSPITTSGTLTITLSGTALPVVNGGTGSTTATGSGEVVLANSASLITPILGVATGTSLSVTGNINSLTHTITGSTSGVITIQGQAAGGTYNYNLPTTAGTSGQVLTSGGGSITAMTWTTPTTGTVTSVAATVPAFLSISGSPITNSGTLAITLSGTALPVTNGGTGSTTSTGSGSVVLANSASLITPVIGAATGTSLSTTGILTSGGTITANGPGTGGSPTTATMYINPASTILSGSNSYFYTFFGTPQTTGSTTGSGTTIYIEGAPTNTTDPYALFINSGATFLGGRLFVATSMDTPAINPDSFNTLIAYDNQIQTAPYSGVPTGSATFVQNNYIQLTPATVPSYGQIYWKRHAGNAFSATFDIYNGTTGGGNGLSFFWHSTAIPSTTSNYNTGITSGYNLIFEDYASGTNPGTSLWYNGTQLGTTVANISTLTNSQFNRVSIIFIRDCIRVFMNGVIIINYQDTTNRGQTHLNAFIGFTGFNVNLGNTHRIRNIRISKTNEGLLEYTSPTSSNITINATNVGIGTVSPGFPLDVSGTGRLTNLLTQNIAVTTVSDIPSINPDAFNSLLVYENQIQTTVYSGILAGNASYLQNNYIQLTPASGSQRGQYYWNINPGNSFSSTFEIYNGTTGGADCISFFWFCTAAPSTTTIYNTGLTGGYNLIFKDFNSGADAGTSLWYNGTQLGSTVANISTLTNSQFNKVTVIFIRDTIRVLFNGLVIINYQDTTNRSINNTHNFMGFAGSTGGFNNAHRVRNIRISKTNEGLWQYSSPTSSNIYINAANVGIGNTAPGFPLDVTGTGNFTTSVITRSLDLTGSTSGVITIQTQAAAGTYNYNLPITAGTTGQVLTSQGGGATAMTWTSAGTGTVTSVAATVPAFLSISGSPITTSGTLAISLSGTALPVANGGTGSTTSTGSGSVVLANSASLITPVIGVATGTSLSVSGVLNSLRQTITGSTSGVITIQGQAAAGTYNYNLPTTAGTAGQVLTSQGGGATAMTWSTPSGTGTVTSVAATVPAFLTVSGSPITTSGTLAFSFSGTALPVANGGTGSTTSTGTGSVVLANTPTLITPIIGSATGTNLSVTGNVNSLTQTITGSTSGVITIKGQAAAGTYNYNLPTNAGTDGLALVSGGGSTIPMRWDYPLANTIWYIREEQIAGTNGGTFTSGAWRDRTLNTIESTRTDTQVTLSGIDIVITPGSYMIEASAPAFRVNAHATRLFINASSIVAALGSSESTVSNSNLSTSSKIITFITIVSTTTYTLQHRCGTSQNTTGFGSANGFQTEVYSQVKVTKLA